MAASGLSAAIAGGVGVGLYPGYGVARALAPVIGQGDPDPAATRAYEPIYALFEDAYRALEPIFERLAALS